MLDFEKIQKKANLAKELVNKGIASDLEEAYEMIENGGLVNSSEDDSKFFENTRINKGKLTESISKADTDEKTNAPPKETKKTSDLSYKVEVLNERLMRLQERVSTLSKHLENLQSYFDTNLQAIETRLKQLEQGFNNNVERVSVEEDNTKQEKEKQEEKPKQKQPEKPKEEPKIDPNISIENIFNNSNNRLV
ncbi:MAG: hypothetical protein PWP03_532 [Candidatus Woesearchaeota archaeon]|nr:hypothetical protein [Candidatus Woesearchaeota archaeon]MDN5327894.1 hypothetical protein [Candidatus Woesearchaeota archaeon]